MPVNSTIAHRRWRSTIRCFAHLALNILYLHLSHQCTAQENRNDFNQLLLPTSRAAQAMLQRSCQLWPDQPLRPTITDVEKQFQIAIWLDRRIDSGQSVSLSRSSDVSTLGGELEKIAISCGAAGGLVENIYTIAPPSRLARIQRSAVVLHGQLTTLDKRLITDSRSISWEDITSSNELLELIRTTWGIELVGAKLPHDLFHQGQLPRCTLATQLTLLLAGFDFQAVVEKPKTNRSAETARTPITLTLQPLSATSHWEDTYARTPTAAQLAELTKKFPSSSFKSAAKNSIQVEGPTNAHIELLSLGLQPKRPTQVAENRFRFSFKTPIPVEAVVTKIAKDFQFELVWSEECTSLHRARQIQLDLDQVTRQELLEAIGKAADLRLVDQKTRVVVSPK